MTETWFSEGFDITYSGNSGAARKNQEPRNEKNRGGTLKFLQ